MENKKNMENKKTTIAKTKEGYGYKYTELADINKYCEENNITYYQEIETCEINQKDYVVTYVTENGETTKHRGCQIVEAKLSGNNNPVQAYGSSLTYCRRYSLLLSLGLATEDDDAESLSDREITLEEAENYTFKGGKHNGWTFKRVIEEDKSFLNWLLGQNDPKIIKMYEVITGEKPMNDEEYDEHIKLVADLMDYIVKYDIDLEEVCKGYKVEHINDLKNEQLKKCVEGLRKRYEK